MSSEALLVFMAPQNASAPDQGYSDTGYRECLKLYCKCFYKLTLVFSFQAVIHIFINLSVRPQSLNVQQH